MKVLVKQEIQERSSKALAWHNGELVEVRFYGNDVRGAKAFRLIKNDKFSKIRGRLNQDENGKLYFV